MLYHVTIYIWSDACFLFCKKVCAFSQSGSLGRYIFESRMQMLGLIIKYLTCKSIGNILRLLSQWSRNFMPICLGVSHWTKVKCCSCKYLVPAYYIYWALLLCNPGEEAWTICQFKYNGQQMSAWQQKSLIDSSCARDRMCKERGVWTVLIQHPNCPRNTSEKHAESWKYVSLTNLP